MITYQKQSQSSEVFCKDRFLVQHCFYSIWTTFIKYADDTDIYVSGNDSESIREKLKTHILEVHNWLINNDLLLNFITRPVIKKDKTECMILAPQSP